MSVLDTAKAQIARVFTRDSWTALQGGNKNPFGIIKGGTEYVSGRGEKEFYKAFRNNAVVRQIIEIPAEDALAKGRTWGSEGIDQPIVDKIVAEEARLEVQSKLIDARIEARLYGGCAILICTDEEDYSEPLDVDAIPEGGITSLSVLNRFNFSNIDIDRSPASPTYNRATMFHFTANAQDTGRRTNNKIHPTRLVIFHGEAERYPTGSLQQSRFWGDSVLKSRLKAIDDLGGAFDDLCLLLSAAKSPTLKIVELYKKLQDADGIAKVQTQIDAFQEFQRNNGLNLIDSTMEFDNNAYTFTGISDNIDQLINRVVAQSGIPRTRLLGEQSKGLSNEGTGDAKIYYDRIKSEQELIIRPSIATMDTAMLRSALGNVPEGLTYKWNPLMTRTSKERAEEFVKYGSELRAMIKDEVLDEKVGIDAITKLVANSDIGEV